MSNEITVIQQEQTALYLQTKAEIDTQIATAKAFPRSEKMFIDKALSMATITEEIAQSCIYALPRGGKPIEGPSVRLAEIIVASYGNLRASARIVDNDGRMITSQGVCHDLENNTAVSVDVKRRITGKDGKTFNDDMQVVTGNAANAIAFRNAVFKVVPMAYTQAIFDKVKDVARGTAATLSDRRNKAVAWFNEKGVKNEQICESLGIKRVEDIDLDKLATLNGMRQALKDGESTVKEMFDNKPEPNIKKEEFTELHFEMAYDAGATIETIRNGYTTTAEIEKQYNEYESQRKANETA